MLVRYLIPTWFLNFLYLLFCVVLIQPIYVQTNKKKKDDLHKSKVIFEKDLYRNILESKTIQEESYDIEKDAKKEKILEEKIPSKDTEILVEGKDEFFMKSYETPFNLILPSRNVSLGWDHLETLKKISRQEASIPSQERIASINLHYGLYNSVDTNATFTNATPKYSYSIGYDRKQKSGEGNNLKIITNSSLSSDSLLSTIDVTPNKIYKLFAKVSYYQQNQGLHNNAFYTKQNKNYWNAQIQNRIRFSGNEINLWLSGNYTNGRLEGVARNEQTARYFHVSGKADWRTFIGKYNSINISSDFLVGRENTYALQDNVYRYGNVFAWFSLPIYFAYVGKEKENKLEVHLKAGMRLFMAQNNQFLPAPYLLVKATLAYWTSILETERRSSIMEITERFTYQNYFIPVYLSEPENAWKIYWSNYITLFHKFKLSAKTGWVYYTSYTTPVQNSEQLYSYSYRRFNALIGEVGWQHQVASFFQYDVLFHGEWQIQSVVFRPALQLVLKALFIYKGFEMHTNLTFTGSRKLDTGSLPYYTLLGIKFKYKFSKNFNGYIEGENLTNQTYIILPPYQTSGLRFIGGLGYHF